MISGRRCWRWGVALACVVLVTPAWANDPLTVEGWSTWRVPAVDSSPDWCC